mgnify:CR=1 FL=1
MTRYTPFRSQLAAMLVAGFMALAVAPLATADDVVALKNALYGAGYDINNVSSQMDSTTRAALEKFQRDNGLTASGVLDESTKEALGMVSIQVASAPKGNSTSASQGTAAVASSQPEPEPVAEAEEEEDDGSWSFW